MALGVTVTKGWQLKLVRWGTLWGWMHRPTPMQVAHEVNSIRLLTRQEMELLFPDCEILTERMLGFIPKSYIAIRRQCVSAPVRHDG